MNDPAMIAHVDAMIAHHQAEIAHHQAGLEKMMAARSALIAGEPVSVPAEPGTYQEKFERRTLTAVDFAGEETMFTTEAAALFGHDKPKLARWCREHGCGYRVGGRWRISVPRLHERAGLV